MCAMDVVEVELPHLLCWKCSQRPNRKGKQSSGTIPEGDLPCSVKRKRLNPCSVNAYVCYILFTWLCGEAPISGEYSQGCQPVMGQIWDLESVGTLYSNHNYGEPNFLHDDEFELIV